MKFAPSHEGVSTLDQQATPAVLRPIHTGIGFVLECRADPAGGTRYYASSGVNEEGTFRGERVSLNADRWERVELAHFCPPKRLFAAVPSLPTSGL
jgi:hypothetical protein